MDECAAAPIIDEDVLQRLREALGSAFPDLIDDCLADVDGSCIRMEEAGRMSDGVGVKRAAHTLAGVLGQFACARAACMMRALAGAPEADALSAWKAPLDIARTSVAALAARK